MWSRALLSVAVLPGTVLVLVPAAILWLSGGLAEAPRIAPRSGPWFWVGLLLVGLGAGLMGWTVSLFARLGRGTLAPWDPPQRLVIHGPYRHVRNPMITGVLLVLAGEAALAWSWLLACWLAVFLAGNALYLPLVEEPALERRFGPDWLRYRRHVPRWLPRVRPWRPPPTGAPPTR